MGVDARNDVRVRGFDAGRPVLFAHGFGCDQSMWRFLSADFEVDHRVLTFDLVGFGHSDVSAFDPVKYGSLRGYAADVVEIAEEHGVRDAVLVGHSVSAMIGVLAQQMAPEIFSALVLIGPNPRYIDDGEYRGGFTRDDIAELLASLDADQEVWATSMAPVFMGNTDRPELSDELASSICRTDPQVARHFARVTFLSDTRAELAGVDAPTLVLQSRDDVIAPETVGQYVHSAIPGSVLTRLDATGHCPHVSAPAETTAAIRAFL